MKFIEKIFIYALVTAYMSAFMIYIILWMLARKPEWLRKAFRYP